MKMDVIIAHFFTQKKLKKKKKCSSLETEGGVFTKYHYTRLWMGFGSKVLTYLHRISAYSNLLVILPQEACKVSI